MANAIVGALRVILGADTAEFDTAMKRTSADAKRWSTDLGSIGRQATALGSSLTKTLTLPIVGLGVAAVKAASDFESSFAGVRKTVEATEPEFAALAQGLRDMSKEIPVNVNELNRVAEAAGQLGIKKDDILQFTRTMADLGVTTNLTADEAATATAQIQNIFGAAGKDVDRFGATLVALGNAGASTEKDIIAMGLRIAGAGNQVGLTQAQVLAFASALSSVGINAEAGGSAISRTFLKINDAVAKGGDDLREFARIAGMTGPAFKQAFETDAAGATVAFINGLARLKKEGENVNATLEGVVGKNIILKDTLLRASGAGQLLNEQLALGTKAWQDNTALTKEATERYKTFESQLTVLWNQIKDVAITLGTSLLPVLKDLIGVATPLVQWIGRAAEMFAALPEPVRMTALGIAGLVAAIGPMLFIFGQVITAAATVAGAFTAKGIATRALTAALGPLSAAYAGLTAVLGPVAVAIGAVWAAWKIGNTETVKNSIAQWGLASENLTARLYRLIAGVEKMTPQQARAAVAATAAAEAAREQAKALDTVGVSFNAVATGAATAVPPIKNVGGAASQTEEELKEAEKAAKAFAASLRSLGGRDALAGAQEVVRQLHAMNGPLNVLPGKLEEMAARLREGAQAALMMGKSDLANSYTKLADTLSPIIMFQQRYNVTLGEYVTMAPQAASWTSELVEQLNRLGGTVTKIGPTLKNSLDLSTLFVRLKASIKENLPDSTQWAQMWDSMTEGLRMTLGNVAQTLSQAFTGGGNVMGAIKSIVSQVGASIGGSIGAMFGPLGQQIGSAIGSMAGMLVTPLKKLFGIGINDEIKKANAEIDKSKAKLIQMHGPMDVLEKKAQAVGLSFAENWGHQGKAGLEAFNKLVDEFNTRWEEMNARREELNSDLQSTQGELDGLIGKAKDLGYEFDQSGQFIGVTFESVKAKAEEFGVSVDGLGPKFRQQGIDAEAAKIVNAFTLLEKAGGDVGGILVGMKDEIGKLVSDSIEFGTTIPENMQPWIMELARTNQLTDENGAAITDLSNLKFGEPVKTEFEKISESLLVVVERLSEIVQAIAAIPTDKSFTVHAEYVDNGPPAGFGDPGTGGRGNGEGFATGTLGRLGKWFGNFPDSGFSTVLHGAEAVVTAGQAPAFAMDVLGSMGGGSTAMGSADMSGVEMRLANLERLWRDFPRAVAVAQSDETSKRRRR